MTRLISLGSLAALFFSSTFVLNRAMSLQGGHWVWTASLRFGFMLIFLVALLLVTQGKKALTDVKDIFLKHWLFWILAGSIGFGVFYSLITFSSQYAAGWVVATTWQTTILATPIVLIFFGRKVPNKGLVFTGIIFVGIILVNIEHATRTSLHEVMFSALPVLVAAFAYPIGNQLVWEARIGHNPRIPKIDHPILENGFARVLLLTLGSLPFWIVLILLSSPRHPVTRTNLQHGIGRFALRRYRHHDLSLCATSRSTALRNRRRGCDPVHGSGFLPDRRNHLSGSCIARSAWDGGSCTDHHRVGCLYENAG